MNPPPPMLPASGSTTSSAKATATAASIALPPCFRISTPACVASGCAVTTIACGAVTGFALSVQVAGMSGLPRPPSVTGFGAGGGACRVPAHIWCASDTGDRSYRRGVWGPREERRGRRGRRERRHGGDGHRGGDEAGRRPGYRGERHDAVRAGRAGPRADDRRAHDLVH